jgi:hypothetical protein
MIASLTAGAAGLVLAAPGPTAFGISASPVHIYARPGHSYTITVNDSGTKPLTVKAALSPAAAGPHGCQVGLGTPVPWASITPAVLHLAPGKPGRATVTVGTPPAGSVETVASFIAAASPSRSGVGASGGVGVAIYTSQPGHAPARTCHHAAARRATPPAAASAVAPQRPWWPLLLAGIGGATVTALIAGAVAAVRRRRSA